MTLICNALLPVAQHLRKEEQNDSNLANLAHNMTYTLSFVTVVRDHARLEKLKLIVREIMELVKSASHFIVDRFTHGRLGVSGESRTQNIN